MHTQGINQCCSAFLAEIGYDAPPSPSYGMGRYILTLCGVRIFVLTWKSVRWKDLTA